MTTNKQLIDIFKLLLVGAIFYSQICCKSTDDKASIISKIEELDEFNYANKYVDSLNQLGIDSQLTISLLQMNSGVLYKEDTLKSISYAMIEARNQFDERILYTIKYDTLTFEITDVIANY